MRSKSTEKEMTWVSSLLSHLMKAHALEVIRSSIHLSLLLPLLLTLLLMGCVSAQAPLIAPPSSKQATMGTLVKPIQLIIKGEPFDLQKSKEDQLTLLSLFKPTCSLCGEVSQTLSKIILSDVATKVQLIGICVEENGCVQLREFQEHYRPRYPLAQLLDASKLSLSEQLPFGLVSAVPTTYLIDSNGALIESFHGSIPLQYVITLIKKFSPQHSPQVLTAP